MEYITDYVDICNLIFNELSLCKDKIKLRSINRAFRKFVDFHPYWELWGVVLFGVEFKMNLENEKSPYVKYSFFSKLSIIKINLRYTGTIFELYNAKKLHCANKNIETITKFISMLTNLRRLDLSGNKIKALPEEFGQLKLTFLDISRNGCKRLDANAVSNILTLRKLHIDYRQTNITIEKLIHLI